MQNRSIVLLFLLLVCAVRISLAQGVNLGVPPIRNFSKKMYKAGTQNWDAAQDSRGVLFFANNEGLLQYDGNTWQCHAVANKTVVRSVAVAPNGRIFVGAQSEFGYFFPDQNGQLRYHSLVHLLPNDQRNFEDVWDIAFWEDAVFFRTNQTVFQYTANQIQVHAPGGMLTAMLPTARGIVLQQNINTLLCYENGQFKPIFENAGWSSALTGAMAWKNDTILLSTLKNGLFYWLNGALNPWTTPQDAQLQNSRIYSATALPNGQLALGTSLDGLLVLDEKRRILRHLTKKNGLQNNNILHTFADRAGNLWLGLDSGIDCTVLDAPFTTVIPDGDLQGTGYAATIAQGHLFLGVSNGVYSTPWQPYFNPESPSFFQKIKSTDGQVWALNTIGDVLLLGHHEGAFRLNGLSNTAISTVPGAWTFVALSDEYMLGGTYSGLVLYQKRGNEWVVDQKLDGLNESCRIMIKDQDGAVWVAHPYRGVYRVLWSPAQKSKLDVQFFNTAHGLPSNLNNFVFSIAGKAVFGTERGVFRFDLAQNRFVPDTDFNRVLGNNQHVKLLKEDTEGNIWYVAGREVGMLLVDDFGLKKEVQKRIFPELSEKMVSGFEFIYPVDRDNVFLGAEQGFVHFNASAKNAGDTLLQVVLSSVHASSTRDSMLFGGYFVENGQVQNQQGNSNSIVLNAQLNNLRFVFSATDFKEPAFVQYRFRLIGLNRTWSDWSGESIQNFTNLGPGKYTFEVQARRKDGRESAVTAYSFRIRPPWYASTAAMVLYALVFLGLFVGFLFQQQRKFEQEKEKLTVEHLQKAAEQQREVERSKAAVTEIQHEKLEAEIQFKNQELASATMHLVQKGEILLTVQAHLDHILKNATTPTVKKEIQQVLNLLNYDAKLDEDWEQFSFHFDQVHVHFLQRLREQYPQLSAHDHKLCAYLRMNLSTKEIAPLMNVSVRGVEASRYRLRKKMGLPNDANLTEVILAL